MQLYQVKYLRSPSPPEIKYVIAADKLEAISISQPFYNKHQPMEYNSIEIIILCPESSIIKK